MQYAQILIDQMVIKKERILREKAVRQNLIADLDYREKINKIRVPEIPTLPNHLKDVKKNNQGQLPSFDELQQNNFGFFDKFYGPTRQYEERFKQSRSKELQEQLGH